MPSRPPETKFYHNPENYTLWRDISRTFEDFCGGDEAAWPERQERFVTVLNDVLVDLRERKANETTT